MVQLKNGNVNIGEKVIYKNALDLKAPKRLGIFESLYQNQMNVRFVSDNSLHTLGFDELEKATPEIVAVFYKNRAKNELLEEVERLNTALKEHGLKAIIEQA